MVEFPHRRIVPPAQREFDPIARERGLDIRFVPSSLTVRSDRRLLRRLLQNLVSNAIKYTPSGRVIVGTAGAAHISILEVWDTGLGIPPSKQRIVFREFQRLDQGAKVARGLGLGLSIVERICRVLGHPVTLRSEAGTRLGVSRRRSGGRRLAGLRLPARSAQAAGDGPCRTFAYWSIDNEPAILEGMRLLLTGWGCDVWIASDLDGAQELIRTHKAAPEVIIADYHLDEGDGLDLIRVLALEDRSDDAGDPGHRGPHAGGAGRRGRNACARSQQAGETCRSAGAAHPMARHASGGGIGRLDDQASRPALRPIGRASTAERLVEKIEPVLAPEDLAVQHIGG